MKNKVSVLFMLTGILFATCLLISNILASKIMMIGPWSAPAGVLIFQRISRGNQELIKTLSILCVYLLMVGFIKREYQIYYSKCIRGSSQENA